MEFGVRKGINCYGNSSMVMDIFFIFFMLEIKELNFNNGICNFNKN